MASEHLDTGIYTNIFQVWIPNIDISVMTISTSKCLNLRNLREEIRASSQKIWVYCYEDIVFGYGTDQAWLISRGFQRKNIRLYDYPKWCARMIVEGLVEHLTQQGYRECPSIGRIKIYEPQPFGRPAQGRLCLFRGYDLRAIYWQRNEQPVFGLVVDICWEIQDASGARLSTPEIAQYNAMTEVSRLQEEYLPDNRINPEVSRACLQNHILPFVRRNSKFALPCNQNVEVTLDTVPLRVVIGV
jgi:hypothetical protein